MVKLLGIGALLLLLGFIVYGTSLKGEFVWDDTRLIVDNPQIKQWVNLPAIFVENIGAQNQEKHSTYRPLHMLSNMIDYSFWGLNPFGYHVTNILLHVCVGLVLYAFIIVVFQNQLLALLTAALFLVHPIHTEAVAYISGRADSLMAIFMLLSFIFYIKSAQNKGIHWYGLMTICFVLGLLSKEYVLILPGLLIVYHLTLNKKWAPKEFFTLLSLCLLFILLRVTEQLGFMRLHAADTTTLGERVPGFFVALTEYLKLIVAPFGLHMEYGRPLFAMAEPKAILGIIFIFGFIFLAMKFREKSPVVTFSIFWFLLSLIPVSNIIPVNAYMAEHWLYIPSIGLFILIALGLCQLYQNKAYRGLAVTLSVGILFLYGGLTVRQNQHWQDPITFYRYTLQYAPQSTRVHNNLGSVYMEQGDYTEAEQYIRRAIALDPSYANAYNNLGMIYDHRGSKKDAAKYYQKAIALDAKHIDAMNNLAVHYVTEGKVEKAIALFNKVIELNPTIVDVHMNLCVVYGQQGQKDKAIFACKQAIIQDPTLTLAYNNMGAALSDLGKKEEAIRVYRKSLKINSKDFYVYNNVGSIYVELKDYEKAASFYEQALQINPQYQMAKDNLRIVSSLKKVK